MPKPASTLRIAEPCSQSWAAMTPQGAGRHCAACQQVVIDFTQKTDAEILAVLAATAGQACGRFGASQLNRALQPVVVVPRAPWWQTAVAATVALLGFRTLMPSKVQAQSITSQSFSPLRSSQPETAPRAMAKPVEVDQRADDNSILLTGRVLEKATGSGIPGVTVLVQGTTIGVSTDYEGQFSLLIPADYQQTPISISAIGFVDVTRVLAPNSQFLKVELDYSVTGQLLVMPIYTPQGMWQRLSSIPWRIRYAFQRH